MKKKIKSYGAVFCFCRFPANSPSLCCGWLVHGYPGCGDLSVFDVLLWVEIVVV